MALGLPIIGYGLIFNLGLAVVGGLIVVIGGFGWGYEPADDPEAHHGPPGHDGHGDGASGAEAELTESESTESESTESGPSDSEEPEPAAVGAGDEKDASDD
jgi:cytochrome c oxidase subunit I